MKFTKTNEKQMREFMGLMDAKGCVPVSEWTSGKGKFTTSRALPPFVKRLDRVEYKPCERPKRGTVERAAMEFFEANPRRRAVLVMDIDAAMGFLFDAALGMEYAN